MRDIERGYADDVGAERFEMLCSTLQALLDRQPRAADGSSTARGEGGSASAR